MKTRKQTHETTVADVMTKRVETLTPVDSIKYALSLMSEWKLTTVPVIDQHDKCIGILSRSDLTEMFLQEDGELANALDSNRLSDAWLNR